MLVAAPAARPEVQAPSQVRQLYGGVDLVKHVFMWAVLFQHMASRTRYTDEVNGFIVYYSQYIDGAVAGFFLISGFFSKQPGRMSGGSLGRIVWRQAWRLLVPFYVFSLIYAISLAALGKASVTEEVPLIADLSGVGPQLYFLPFLFGISVLVCCLEAGMPATSRGTVMILLVVLLGATSALLPTPIATGPNLALLPFYSAMYLFGVVRARYSFRNMPQLVVLAAFAVLVAYHTSNKVYDAALVLVLFEAGLSLSGWQVLSRRFPGSGGVYLLHTPVLNFAVSTVLFRFGVLDLDNVFLSLVLTYLVALSVTLMLIKFVPSSRRLLLE